MILRKIKLHPFAGITNREIAFEPGLNVISGKNEAGKSTIMRALYFSLFVPSNLGGIRGQEKINDFLPANGGDTIAVELEFEVENVIYNLYKKWGGTKSSDLRSSTGITITDPTVVQDKLKVLLGHNEATWRNVLFANQGMLTQTIELIKKEDGITSSFNDILRSAVMLQAGISPDKLMAEVQAKIDELTPRWVLTTGRPEINSKGQGDLSNPWKTGAGSIVKIYYLIGECREGLRGRAAYDRELDTLVTELDELKVLTDESEKFIKSNEPLVNDLRIRKDLEYQYSIADSKLEKLKKNSMDWALKSVEKTSLEKMMDPLKEDIRALEEELRIANLRQGMTVKKNMLGEVQKLQVEITGLEQKGKGVLPVKLTDFEKAENLNRSIEQIKIKLEAQKLKVSLIANNEVLADIASGMEVSKPLSIKKGETFDLVAPSRFVMKTPDFTLKVESGETDVVTLSAEYDNASNSLTEILDGYGLGAIEDLIQLKNSFDIYVKSVNEKRRELDITLGGTLLPDLEKEVTESDLLPATRGVNELQVIITQKKTDFSIKINDIGRLNTDIANLIGQYETPGKLEDEKLDQLVLVRGLKTKIDALKPLPENMGTADEFFIRFDTAKRDYDTRSRLYTDLSSNKRIHESNVPEKSEEDLRDELNLLELEFKNKIDQAKGYVLIREKLEYILEESNEAAFDPYYLKTNNYLSALTDRKYSEVHMVEVLPGSISGNGITLKTGLLSQGTNDTLALALRLSMADYFLKDMKGFLILDDPLTDMDPERQLYAKNCLQYYAEARQVLLFTCQPAQTALFTGNQIALNIN